MNISVEKTYMITSDGIIDCYMTPAQIKEQIDIEKRSFKEAVRQLQPFLRAGESR